MAAATSAQLAAAETRGHEMTDSRAAAAHYDPAGRVVIELLNSCTYAFPVELAQDLQGAKPDELGLIEVEGLGFNLQRPKLNVDLYVPALVSGIFGTQA